MNEQERELIEQLNNEADDLYRVVEVARRVVAAAGPLLRHTDLELFGAIDDLRVELEREDTAQAELSRKLTAVAPSASASEAMQDDIAALLRALGTSDHARDMSPHEVMTKVIIPEAERLRAHPPAVTQPPRPKILDEEVGRYREFLDLYSRHMTGLCPGAALGHSLPCFAVGYILASSSAVAPSEGDK